MRTLEWDAIKAGLLDVEGFQVCENPHTCFVGPVTLCDIREMIFEIDIIHCFIVVGIEGLWCEEASTPPPA